MPNHVSNRLTITGAFAPVRTIRDTCFTDNVDPDAINMDFNAIIPTPAYIYQDNLVQGSSEQKNGRNWYDWNIENWGTKWNAYDTVILQDIPDHPIPDYDGNHTLQAVFDTAWSPPTPVVRRLAHDFPDTEIYHEYIDECWNFWGTATYAKGVETHTVDCGGMSPLDPDMKRLRDRLAIELQYRSQEDIDDIDESCAAEQAVEVKPE